MVNSLWSMAGIFHPLVAADMTKVEMVSFAEKNVIHKTLQGF